MIYLSIVSGNGRLDVIHSTYRPSGMIRIVLCTFLWGHSSSGGLAIWALDFFVPSPIVTLFFSLTVLVVLMPIIYV